MNNPDDETLTQLATQVGEALLRTHQFLSCAESCTGGFISKVITDIAGSSQWFDRGFVTYTNAAKTDMLGVSTQIIQQHGAVSEATVRAMAAGALRHSQAGISLAVTGVAGPGGGRPDKPVGTVWFAWASRGGLLSAQQQLFSGDREAVRRQTVDYALQGVLARVG